MKKVVYSVIALACVGVLSAQTTKKSTRFGLRLSTNFSSLNVKVTEASPNFSAEKNGTKVGFAFGPTLQKSLSDNVDLVIGAELLSAGGSLLIKDSLRANPRKDSEQYSPVTNTRETTIDYRFTQVEVPIMIKMKSSEVNYMQFFGQVGAAVSARVGSKIKRTDKYANGQVSTTNDYEVGVSAGDDKKSTYLSTIPLRTSLLVGAGVDYNVSEKNTLFASLNYNYGFLIPALDQKRNENGGKINSKLSYFQISVGVLF